MLAAKRALACATIVSRSVIRCAMFAAVAIFWGAERSDAQIPQVVQLPSFSTFRYSGAVSVPDGGTASLGGVRRSGSFSSSSGFGPFRSRVRGGFASASGLSVSARIIDLDEMDRQLLNAQRQGIARGLGGGTRDSIRDREIALARLQDQRRRASNQSLAARQRPAVGQRTIHPPRIQVATPNAAKSADRVTVDADLGRATALVRYARDQQRSGDVGLARIAYRMAIEQLDGHPRHAARARQELAAIAERGTTP